VNRLVKIVLIKPPNLAPKRIATDPSAHIASSIPCLKRYDIGGEEGRLEHVLLLEIDVMEHTGDINEATLEWNFRGVNIGPTLYHGLRRVNWLC
jgi:hypothetical protein